MVTNFIYTVLLLIVGSVVAAAILLFGVKFWKDGDKPSEDDVTYKGIVLHLLKNYPFWIWLVVFLVFQPAIIHIINVWTPTLWTNYEWIPSISDFIGFITVVFFFVIFYITDDSGKLNLSKKIGLNPPNKLPSSSRGAF